MQDRRGPGKRRDNAVIGGALAGAQMLDGAIWIMVQAGAEGARA